MRYVLLFATLLICCPGASAQETVQGTFVTLPSQQETLDRGLVVVRANGAGRFLSWRMLGSDDARRTTWTVLCDGEPVAEELTVTNYQHKTGDKTATFRVVTSVDGIPVDTTPAVCCWERGYYLPIPLRRPEGGKTTSGEAFTYTPGDCSVGDLDGDGRYEIILKWDPSNAHDNSHTGETGPVLIDAYTLDGTWLWRIDLGPNIRAGAHYTQMVVYDLDGDGRAELLVKTAPGSMDGQGHCVSAAASDRDIRRADNSIDYREPVTPGYGRGTGSGGRILSGPEWLTVFDGPTGRAVHTVYYNPNRAGTLGGAPNHPEKSFWGDDYGNRADRYLACAAYLSGPNERPSAVFCRGYYTRAYLWAVDFDGKHLSTRWLHASTSPTSVTLTDHKGHAGTTTYATNTSGLSTSYTAYGQGNHNLAVGDVDGDGCDEILYGSCAIDHDGTLLYSVGYGHGDAMHLAPLNPDREGLQMFDVHEDGAFPYGWDIHDAATGEVLFAATGTSDNGRGMAAHIRADERGYDVWSRNDPFPRSAVSGLTTDSIRPSNAFRLYWDGDLLDDLYAGTSPTITKGDGTLLADLATRDYGHCHSCNGSKGTPCLSADILGDWREEVICYSSDDPATLILLTTNITTPYALPTLMHDHTYRMSIVWQNTAYNQPPHTGYYLPDMVEYLRSKP